jgi:HMG (high mobility group) box
LDANESGATQSPSACVSEVGNPRNVVDIALPIRQTPKRFAAMAKAMGSKWKALTSSQRRRYEELAATDQERYRKEKQEYREKQVRESTLGAAYLERKHLANLQSQVAVDATQTQPNEQLHPHDAEVWYPNTNTLMVTANSDKASSNADKASSSPAIAVEQAPLHQPDTVNTVSLAPLESARNEVIDTAREILFLQRQLSNLEQAQSLLMQWTGPSTSSPMSAQLTRELYSLEPTAMSSRSPSTFPPSQSAGMHLHDQIHAAELQVSRTHQVLPIGQNGTQLQPAQWCPPFEIPAAAASFRSSTINTSSDEGLSVVSSEPSGMLVDTFPTEVTQGQQGLGSEPALNMMVSLLPQQQVQLLLACAKVAQELSQCPR